MRHDFDSFITYADIDGCEQAEIHEGQIRYDIKLADVPLESQEFLQVREALKNGNRVEITMRVLPIDQEG